VTPKQFFANIDRRALVIDTLYVLLEKSIVIKELSRIEVECRWYITGLRRIAIEPSAVIAKFAGERRTSTFLGCYNGWSRALTFLRLSRWQPDVAFDRISKLEAD
jgi:hypothetical protein